MLVDFFFELRARKLLVTPHEWMTLLEGLARGLHGSSLDGFYQLARGICVKDVSEFDAFDEAFLSYFKDVEIDRTSVTEEILEWLRDARHRRALTEEEKAQLQSLDLDELMKLFEERLREQSERHDGGNRWIGTGGTSPFGNSGFHPTGLQIGGGGGRSAMQVAALRRFREYRKDIVLDVRQIDVALRGLRRLGREGAEEELDLDETVDATCRNAGELDLIFHPPKRNRMKVLLLMDVGGSMDPHARLVERLFTAASRTGRFARFRHYYFHNCVYSDVYEDAAFYKPVPVADLISASSRDERLVVVGDALMHPAELLEPGAGLYFYRNDPSAGATWLRRLDDYFRYAAWLNPEPIRFWPRTTIEVIASIFPMWPLTLQGLEGAVRYLVRGGERPPWQPEIRRRSI